MKSDSSEKGLFSWALYDWANSAYFVMILTFIFSAYFTSSVAESEERGTALWGNMVGIAGFFIAILAPILGSIADEGGRRKPWVLFFTVLSVFGCIMLWFVEPDESFIVYALIMAFIATIGAELSLIFYNAMLPDLARPFRMGRWSGWAWALGYLGGLVCLVVGYFIFYLNGVEWFGLDENQAQNTRVTFLLTGVWYALFSLPFFFFTPDQPSKQKTYKQAVSDGMKRLKESLSLLKKHKNVSLFLVARLFYNDGLATIFAMGGVYAAGTFGFDTAKIFYFGIGLNLTAGLGAYIFSWMDDKMGSKATILVSLIGLIIPVTAVIIVEEEIWFWVWGLLLGVFVGPVQAASRTLMGRMSPPDKRNQMYGLFALSGKVTTFAGPILVGWITYLMSSQRWGMTIILSLLVVGLLLMFKVQEPEKEPI